MPIRRHFVSLALVLGLLCVALAVGYGQGAAATTPREPVLCWNWDAPFGRLAFRPDPRCSRWIGGYSAVRAEFDLNQDPYGPESYYQDDPGGPSA
jgi:hypothetical protein